jgi:type II secretory pathway pseudopilin PulG
LKFLFTSKKSWYIIPLKVNFKKEIQKMKKIKNQKGFSHVEVILLTVIVGIILVVGWYVWHSVSQADKNLSSANSATNASPSKKSASSSPSSSSAPKNAKTVSPASPIPASIVSANPVYQTTTPTVVNNFITVNEWNVKFKHDGTITIMYAHDSNDKSAHAVFFSSSQLAGKNKACKAEFYPAGYIVRFKGDEHYLDEKGKDSGKASAEFVNANSSITFKKIGDYFYFYRGPAGKCAELKEIQDLQDQTSEAVKAFFQSVVAA